MERKWLRSVEQIWEDDLWPPAIGGGLQLPDPLKDGRHQAIAEVLACIPEEDYEKLKAAVDSFTWFIPDTWMQGRVQPFFATVFPEPDESGFHFAPYAQVIYLSPLLERAAWDIIVAVVAHELAHIVLGHKLFLHQREYEAREEAVFQRVCEWGFDKEAKKHRAVGKWRDSWEKYQIRKLKEKLYGEGGDSNA